MKPFFFGIIILVIAALYKIIKPIYRFHKTELLANFVVLFIDIIVFQAYP